MKRLVTIFSIMATLVLFVACGGPKPATGEQKPEGQTPTATTEAKKSVAIVYSTGGKGDKSFNEKESKNLFEAILKHKKSLDEILNRDVGISVATLDYLQNIKKLFHYPTIVEESTSDFLTDSTTKDGLTNLYVRDVLDIFLRKEIDNAKRQNSYVSFMLIDIDDFKKVNDTYGHQKGDEVLEKIGKILNNSSRKMDFAARYGGEELCLVLPNTKSDKAYEIATRIREKIKSFIFDDFFVTVSIGISQSDENINDEIKLIRKADKALYKAKENGKDQVVIF